MRKETSVKTHKNLAILLLSSFLILGAIPHVVVASDVEWMVIAHGHFANWETDFHNLNEIYQKDQWQNPSEYSKYVDLMYTDSQAAIKWSESYSDTTKCMKRVKEEFKNAMEGAGQAGIYLKKGIEANITGNTADEAACSQKFNEGWKSYVMHKENVYNLEYGVPANCKEK